MGKLILLQIDRQDYKLQNSDGFKILRIHLIRFIRHLLDHYPMLNPEVFETRLEYKH